ncbi:MAG: tetraacyldisaccharide 4'-kinase [Planctomycetota bacterium]|jgi:tetraacyldisaccharide 4'-kinase
MNYEQSYRRLISGQSSGFGACLLRLLLAIAAIGYSLVVWLRNFLYSKGWLKSHHVDAAVLCIGNITVGGTGKTPLVVWLCNQLRQKEIQCAILTRGYKSRGQETETVKDEPVILAKSCPEAKVIVNPDRVAGAAEAVGKYGAKVLIMDDGFQHRRLARDLDIVTIDATQPFGYGKTLPAGLLREPVTSLKRASAVVITRCDQIAEAELGQLEKKLRAIHPNMIIAKSIHAAVSVKYPEPFVIPAKAGIRKDSVEQLKGKRIFVFCGIGNPDAFLNTIKALGSELVGSKVYDDHYHYTDHCLADVYRQAEHLGADLVLTTQKDWTKIAELASVQENIPLAYLAVEIRFLAGEDKLRGLIEDTLAGRIPQK